MSEAQAQLDRGDTVVSVTVGSRLFGTDTPTSDYDYIHIYRPHLKRLILGHNDQPGQQRIQGAMTVESTMWSLQHFFKLLAQGQTQALEIMFAPVVHVGHPSQGPNTVFWKAFKKEFDNNRAKWISKNTAAFVGYCKSQANKYSVKGERLEAVKYIIARLRQYASQGRMTRKLLEYPDLLEELRKIRLPYLGTELIESQGNYVEHINCCNVKCPVHFTLVDAQVIYERLEREYGKRAQEALGNGAIDWKALSHAARVTIEAKELLKDHTITLPLKEEDRQYVKAIKAGQIAHSEVVEYLDRELAVIEELRRTCTLAESLDRQLYEEWIIRAYKGEKVG